MNHKDDSLQVCAIRTLFLIFHPLGIIHEHHKSSMGRSSCLVAEEKENFPADAWQPTNVHKNHQYDLNHRILRQTYRNLWLVQTKLNDKRIWKGFLMTVCLNPCRLHLSKLFWWKEEMQQSWSRKAARACPSHENNTVLINSNSHFLWCPIERPFYLMRPTRQSVYSAWSPQNSKGQGEYEWQYFEVGHE